MKKKKFRWWFIPLGLIILILVLLIGIIIMMHSMLPWENLLAATSNLKMELTAEQKEFIEGEARDYSTLPNALVMADGTDVTTTEEFETRKTEILALFEENVYGPLPQEGFTTSFEVVEEGVALNGAAIRKQVKITVSTDKGSSDALMLLYVPNTDTPAPVIIGLNSNGNHAAIADENVLPSYSFDTEDGSWEEKRGEKAYRWNIEDSISRGYAVATIYSGDFAPDSGDGYATRVVSLFDEEEFKAVGAWSFGLMRAVDYMQEDTSIDAGHIAVVGHSRLGKAAVWAGANDTRIGMVISNDSGNSGASLSRSNRGETVYSINLAFPYWFCSKYAEYGNNENALPVDQNLLLASIAPRLLYVASAEDDMWSDPQGAWNSLMQATNAFALYGFKVIEYSESQPEVDTAVWTESMGYHVRSGWHDMQADDWEFYLDYMDTYFLTRASLQ